MRNRARADSGALSVMVISIGSPDSALREPVSTSILTAPDSTLETMLAAWEDGVDLRLMKTRSKHLMHMRDEPERYERRAPRLTHGPAHGQILSL